MLNILELPEESPASSSLLELDKEDKIELTIEDCIGQSIAVVGTPGSGKSNTSARFLEQTRPYIPQHLLDIHNEYFGLAEKFDYLIVGKNAPPDEDGIKPKSPPVHIEVGVGQAAQIAEFAYRNRLSVIVQMLYMSPAERLEFAHAYCWKLWQLNITATRPLIVLLEEAHNYIPQVIGNSPVLEQMSRFSSEGRKFGFTVILATQRTAKINKDILADCNSMFLHAVNIDNDFSTYTGMTPYSKAEIKKICLEMRPGEAIVKTKTAKGTFFNRVTMLKRETFHGGTTPGLEESPPPALRMADGEVLQKLQQLLKPSPPPDPLPASQGGGITDVAHDAHVDSYIDDLRMKLAAANAAIKQLQAAAPDPDREHLHEVMAGVNTPIIAEVVKDIPAGTVTIGGEWDGRSDLATTRAKKKQERDFEKLIGYIRSQSKMHRLILVYLTQREHTTVLERNLARFVGYALRTLTDHRPTALEMSGLIKRSITEDRTDYRYQSTVRQYVEQHFPDLIENELVEQICKLEKV